MFFDGFKAIEAIGGVDPNGIVMDKDERLACSRWKYLCYYLKPKEFVIITCTILRDWSGVLESVKYEALLSAISEFRKSQMSANSYSQPTVRILTKKPWTVTFNSSSNCLVIINRLMEILCINKVIVSWAVKRHKNKARQISSAEGASR